MAIWVMVAENAHYMDERSSYELGTFESLDAAIAASKRIVDDYLKSAYHPGMTAKALFESYTMFGEDPYVVDSDMEGGPFSAWDYARERCAQLCSQGQERNDG